MAGMPWAIRVRPVAGRDHRGRAAVRQRRVARRSARPHRRVFGLHAVRRHTVRVRGQDGADQHAPILRGVRPRAAHVRRAVLVHARIACPPVRRGTARRSRGGTQVSPLTLWTHAAYKKIF